MAGEAVLIVDDAAVNLKLTRILLINEGYKVMTAANAAEAIELLRGFRPELVLADVKSPAMDGIELARRLKQDESTRDIMVVAVAAAGADGLEQKAMEAGCAGYISRPIDARTLGIRIRGLLDNRAAAQEPAAGASLNAEMQALRVRFLAEGREKTRDLLLNVEARFDTGEAAKSVHQWVGTGGLLGYSAISRLARETEAVLLDVPLDNAQLRESLTNLALAFSSPREARDAQVSDAILEALTGKRVAVVGFATKDQERLRVALDRAKAVASFFEPGQPRDSAGALACDLAVVYVHPETVNSTWLDNTSARSRPIVLAGSRDNLLALPQPVQSLAREFLMDSWQPEEALVRLSLALSPRYAAAGNAPSGLQVPASGRTQVVIADDDRAVLALVRTALQNFGMDCKEASDGAQAIEVIRQTRPHLAVLDVNMPGMDGYEVLAAIRAEALPVRVLLLTARQQESDIIRGFTLGADDYVVKPFSPMELVARLKRLLTA